MRGRGGAEWAAVRAAEGGRSAGTLQAAWARVALFLSVSAAMQYARARMGVWPTSTCRFMCVRRRCVSMRRVASQYTEASMKRRPVRLRLSSPKLEMAVPSEIMSTAMAIRHVGRGSPNSACTIIVTTGVKPLRISMKETVR
jgi:hypothetical protein